MDYSAANTTLWTVIIQLGLISGAVLLSIFLRQKVSFIRKTLMPIAVMAGFLLLILKYIVKAIAPDFTLIDTQTMEILVYHGIALGFIAMSLRTPPEREKKKGDLVGLRSGAVIVGSYLVQGAVGLLITLLLSYTFLPDLYKASGILLPMGYGQGPGQANNVGTTLETNGFAGGRSFGLSIAAAGYLVACVVGVIIINILAKRGHIRTAAKTGEQMPGADFFQDKGEIPVSDSIDKLSVQIAMVAIVYFATFLTAFGLTSAISAISARLAKTLNSLIWGFNFIIGAALAILVRTLLNKGKKAGLIRRQYQNNYLLNRISGFFFDIMIVAGIASIDIEDLSGLWVPFLLLAVVGGIVTWLHLAFVCKKVYPDYYYEGLVSMFGMMTGTISSGVVLLRELDPDLSTPAANNLVTGSSFGIILGAPVLALVSLCAGGSDLTCWLTVLIAVVYYLLLLPLVLKGTRKKAKAAEQPEGKKTDEK